MYCSLLLPSFGDINTTHFSVCFQHIHGQRVNIFWPILSPTIQHQHSRWPTIEEIGVECIGRPFFRQLEKSIIYHLWLPHGHDQSHRRDWLDTSSIWISRFSWFRSPYPCPVRLVVILEIISESQISASWWHARTFNMILMASIALPMVLRLVVIWQTWCQHHVVCCSMHLTVIGTKLVPSRAKSSAPDIYIILL